MEKEIFRLKKSVKLSGVKDRERVLDVGCGESIIKRFLPRSVDYTGVDITGGRGIIKWNLEKGLPPLNVKFDVIFFNEVLEHIENHRTLLKKCSKILSKTGRIIISTPSPNRFIVSEDLDHIHCFRKTNIKNLARMCGLKVTKIIGKYITIPVLHVTFPFSLPFYSDGWIYRLEKLES